MKINTDKAAMYIATGLLRLQSKFAKMLGKFASSWKRKQQFIFLYMILLVFGGLSIISVVQSFDKMVLSMPKAIKVPRNIHTQSAVRITEKEFKQVREFTNSLDSATLKKLKVQRPGLLDSLEKVEQLYYSQKK